MFLVQKPRTAMRKRSFQTFQSPPLVCAISNLTTLSNAANRSTKQSAKTFLPPGGNENDPTLIEAIQ